MSILEVGAIGFTLARKRRQIENREDIISDGWVTRWSDGPELYRKEQRAIERRGYEEIALIVFLAITQIVMWMFL